MADDLEPIVTLVAQRSGMALSNQQRERLRDAARKRLAGTDVASFVRLLESTAGAKALLELVSVISVHKTDLFRDAPQLDALERHVLAPLVQLDRPLEVWSAGCATGEEVATLLLLLTRAGAHRKSQVLGTDVSPTAIERATRLCFSAEAMRRVPPELARHFSRGPEGSRLDAALASRARFQVHNLMEAPYPSGGVDGRFDLIVCRNVLIYFTAEAADEVVGRLADRLTEDGTLVLSAAEPILRSRTDLETVRFDTAFFYRRRRPRPVPGSRPSAPSPSGRLPSPIESQPRPSAPSPSGRLPSPIDAPPRPSAPSPSGRLPSPMEAQPRPSAPSPSGRLPSPMEAQPRPSAPSPSGRLPVMTQPAPSAPRASSPSPPPSDPSVEGERLFELVLQWSAEGQPDTDTEAGLRKALYLCPDLAAARYCLGLLLERRQLPLDAQTEYRRALSALELGRARATPFFLNPTRLRSACQQALSRLTGPAR